MLQQPKVLVQSSVIAVVWRAAGNSDGWLS